MCRHAICQSGASLLELLAVSALIVVMAGLLHSSIGSFSSSVSRRGAVNILMNAFEYARVTALESGQTVHVICVMQIAARSMSVMGTDPGTR